MIWMFYPPDDGRHARENHVKFAAIGALRAPLTRELVAFSGMKSP